MHGLVRCTIEFYVVYILVTLESKVPGYPFCTIAIAIIATSGELFHATIVGLPRYMHMYYPGTCSWYRALHAACCMHMYMMYM